MKFKIERKQNNSDMCLVCGLSNEVGLKAFFYETANRELVALFTPRDQHQSYPGRLHGGLSTAILDETIGRAICIGKDDKVWGVTVELNVKFRKPVPLHQELRVVGRVTKEGGRIFEGSGELLLPDGQVAVSAEGRYMKLALEKIIEADPSHLGWRLVESALDPEALELPDRAPAPA
jgi:acyl-coenzyme A thioesterase PaaI-like protein